MKKALFFGLTVMVLMLTLNSCNKLDDDYSYVEISAVSAVNVVPGSAGLDIGLDQNKLNNGWEVFSYNHVLNYKNAYPGNRLVRVFDPKAMAGDTALVRKNVNFTPGKYYSLYIIGKDKIDVLATEDDFGVLKTGLAKFRFMNLSPEAPKLTLTLNTTDSLSVKDKMYKDLSAFKNIKSSETYTLKINGAGMTELVGEFKPEDKEVYTIYAAGLKSSNESNKKYSFQIVKHK
ncbi:DUF4397 domain-containing protein [Sphingobacterium sp. SRCM116780]|uniref:DUF4397 domain-containing protein n=1 Tax=Sphingobacterium sp. SRCM116780 TaxID=2907623 RepID=UPI001F1CBD0D|nr:DUF4397 domain-containing protein [Sphingobacterium sp. SRCM116780]UIR55093.1 DUF4397 domain-containing protein [Sphingobacterium sp. SRCM116780]